MFPANRSALPRLTSRQHLSAAGEGVFRVACDESQAVLLASRKFFDIGHADLWAESCRAACKAQQTQGFQANALFAAYHRLRAFKANAFKILLPRGLHCVCITRVRDVCAALMRKSPLW
jgi:hypothetical protein